MLQKVQQQLLQLKIGLFLCPLVPVPWANEELRRHGEISCTFWSYRPTFVMTGLQQPAFWMKPKSPRYTLRGSPEQASFMKRGVDRYRVGTGPLLTRK